MSREMALACIVLILLAGSLACTPTGGYFGDTTPPEGQVLYVANGYEPRSLDPHRVAADPEGHIILSLLEGLTVCDPKTAEPLPGLATSWERNADATVWTFHMREGAIWSDGAPITADDFVYSWRRYADAATAAPFVDLIYYVKNGQAINEGKIRDSTQLGVRAVDPHTFEVTMEHPTAFFVALTAIYPMVAVPRQAVERWGNAWTEPGHMVTSGAFRLVERVPYDRVVVERSDSYWDAANVRLERAVFLPLDDLNTEVNLYKANYVHVTNVLQGVPTAFVRFLGDKRDFTASPIFGTYYYSLNVKRPPLDDVRVRRALGMAIDKRAISERLLQGASQPATTYVAPGVAGYTSLRELPYDPEGARRLLAEAGYPRGEGFPEIRIFFNTFEQHRQVAEAVQSMWKRELGIPVVLANQEWQVFQATREQRQFDVARNGVTGDYLDPNSMMDFYAADSPRNHCGWVDPRFTELMGRANSEADPGARLRLLAEAEAVLLDAAPIIPLFHYAEVGLKKPFVDGWYTNPLGVHPLKFVRIRTQIRAQ